MSIPPNSVLKTNLQIVSTRLKLLQKKKAELTQRSRKQIADLLTSGRVERARVLTEHVIREDYKQEALDIVEMYCEVLLSRFDLFTRQKSVLDDGLKEAVANLIYAAPRIRSDVPEMRSICDSLLRRMGHAPGVNLNERVDPNLETKLGVINPPKTLIERYLVEIAKCYNVFYTADVNWTKQGEDANAQEAMYLEDLLRIDKTPNEVETRPVKPKSVQISEEAKPSNISLKSTKHKNQGSVKLPDVPTHSLDSWDSSDEDEDEVTKRFMSFKQT